MDHANGIPSVLHTTLALRTAHPIFFLFRLYNQTADLRSTTLAHHPTQNNIVTSQATPQNVTSVYRYKSKQLIAHYSSLLRQYRSPSVRNICVPTQHYYSSHSIHTTTKRPSPQCGYSPLHSNRTYAIQRYGPKRGNPPLQQRSTYAQPKAVVSTTTAARNVRCTVFIPTSHNYYSLARRSCKHI